MRPEWSGSLAAAHHQPSLPRHPLFSLPSLRLSPKSGKNNPENDPGCGSPGYSFHNPIIQSSSFACTCFKQICQFLEHQSLSRTSLHPCIMRLNRGVFLSHLSVWLLWQTRLCHRECVLSWHTGHSGHTVSVSSSWLEESLWEACGGQPGRRPRLRDCLNPPVLRSHICPVLSPVQIYITLNVHKYTNIQVNTNNRETDQTHPSPSSPLKLLSCGMQTYL